MFKWLFHILIFATSGKHQINKKPLKRQRKLGLAEMVMGFVGHFLFETVIEINSPLKWLL